MATSSYNGWPASDDKASIGVVSSDVFPGGAKAGDVTTVLGYVARQLHARVEPCIDGWNWGYTYKANVNNPSQLSCHASGTAIDWNAPDHPNGSSGTFTSAQVTTIYTILAEVEGAVSWLQGYDEMHFEICVNATTLAGVAARLGGSTPPTPTPPPEEDMPLNDADKAWLTTTIEQACTAAIDARGGQFTSWAKSGVQQFLPTEEGQKRLASGATAGIDGRGGQFAGWAKQGSQSFAATEEFARRVADAVRPLL